ncbi:hypothetical protein CBR_g26022 [Chara braunii]|uniref:Uncharacterized protein n=1 Tax=Chara braunii TaxID=69332 RepID=A0A388L726_CHABU|nr:hypothetical protein CBR_g26022 [Chara braunii]|eukprot:GBG78084.1 hypothetical protein CBR_g26022 [Chara braunii]
MNVTFYLYVGSLEVDDFREPVAKQLEQSSSLDFHVKGKVVARVQYLGITSPRFTVYVDCSFNVDPIHEKVSHESCGIKKIRTGSG